MSPKPSFDTRIGPFTENISKLLSSSPSLDQKIADYIPEDSRKSNIHETFSNLHNYLDFGYSERIKNQKLLADLRTSIRRNLPEKSLADIKALEERLIKLGKKIDKYFLNRGSVPRHLNRIQREKIIKLNNEVKTLQ